MDAEESRTAAREIIATIPVMMQSIMFELRRAEEFMPMPHFGALMWLVHTGPCTMTDLAERQRVSLPTMSNTVSVLVERGWAERFADEHDRRRTEVRLTEAGRDAVRRMHAKAEVLVAGRLGELSDAELEELRAGVAMLRKAFGPRTEEPAA